MKNLASLISELLRPSRAAGGEAVNSGVFEVGVDGLLLARFLALGGHEEEE